MRSAYWKTSTNRVQILAGADPFLILRRFLSDRSPSLGQRWILQTNRAVSVAQHNKTEPLIITLSAMNFSGPPHPSARKQVRFRTVSLGDMSDDQMKSLPSSWPGSGASDEDQEAEMMTPDHTACFYPSRKMKPSPRQVASTWNHLGHDPATTTAPLIPSDLDMGTNYAGPPLPPRPAAAYADSTMGYKILETASMVTPTYSRALYPQPMRQLNGEPKTDKDTEGVWMNLEKTNPNSAATLRGLPLLPVHSDQLSDEDCCLPIPRCGSTL